MHKQKLHKEAKSEVNTTYIDIAQHTLQLITIFDSVSDGLVIYDQLGTIVQANEAARSILHIEMPQGQPLPQENTSYPILLDEHGQPLTHEQLPFTRILRGETLNQGTAMHTLLSTSDGQKTRLTVSGAPLYDRQGYITGVLCVFRDFTEGQRLEKRIDTLNVLITMVEALLEVPALADSVTTLHELSSLTYQIGASVVALTQRILACSHVCMFAIDQYTHTFHPVALQGYSPEQEGRFKAAVIGTRLSYLLSDPAIIARLEAQETLSFDAIQSPFLYFGDKDNPDAVSLLAPICASQRLIGLLGIAFANKQPNNSAEDIALIKTITKLSALAIEHEQKTAERDNLLSTLKLTNMQMRQANTRLEQINKSLNDFIMTMGHEFRTALTGIQGFSELLCEGDCSNEEVKDYATDILTDAQRLSRMINGLLDLERMKTGKMTLQLDRIDLNEIITNAVTRIHLNIQQFTISLHLDETLPTLVADHDKIIQIMVNLMSNAIKYSPAGGAITVSSKREGDLAHVIVHDHGIGIPKEALEQIFIPYNRLEADKTRYVQGTGLGLPIVRQITEMHGGRAWAESEPGQGSSLHFTLPIKRTQLL